MFSCSSLTRTHAAIDGKHSARGKFGFGQVENGREIELPTAGGYCCAGDILAGATLVTNGAGLFQAYRFVVERQIREGILREVLPDFGRRSRPFSLLYPHRRHLSLRVRTFVEYLVAELAH